MLKRCNTCRAEKQKDSFYRASHAPDGRCYSCKKCMARYAKKYSKTPHGRAAKRRAMLRLVESGYYRQLEMTTKTRFSRARRRAAGLNLKWTLTFDVYEWLISKPCTYCKLPLDQRYGYGLDRIKNNKGYTKDNVVPCCTECNRIRSDIFSVGEMKEFLGPAIRAVRLSRKRVPGEARHG